MVLDWLCRVGGRAESNPLVQPKLSRSTFSWLWPPWVEIKNVTWKPSSFVHRLPDSTRRFATDGARLDEGALLAPVATMQRCRQTSQNQIPRGAARKNEQKWVFNYIHCGLKKVLFKWMKVNIFIKKNLAQVWMLGVHAPHAVIPPIVIPSPTLVRPPSMASLHRQCKG